MNDGNMPTKEFILRKIWTHKFNFYQGLHYEKKRRNSKNMLLSNQLEFIMEAHNGLSAKLWKRPVSKEFGAVVSSISAALGVRDNNEGVGRNLSPVLEFMSDATSIPIMLDADTGYSNFNNARRLVHKLEQRGVAAMHRG